MKFLKLKNKIKKLENENFSLGLSKIKLVTENERLKQEVERLKESKTIANISINGEDLAQTIIGLLKENEEHKCTPECFGKHVIKAIQSDFDSHGRKFRERFIRWWFFNLEKEYPWLESLYIVDEKIYFKSKESSI